MSVVIKPTKTISLRIPVEYDRYILEQSQKTSRTKSNYIKWLIQEKINSDNQFWAEKKANAKIIGEQAFADHGLKNPDQDSVYNFFKNI
jgi:predicted DNA-binding protein